MHDFTNSQLTLLKQILEEDIEGLEMDRGNAEGLTKTMIVAAIKTRDAMLTIVKRRIAERQ